MLQVTHMQKEDLNKWKQCDMTDNSKEMKHISQQRKKALFNKWC